MRNRFLALLMVAFLTVACSGDDELPGLSASDDIVALALASMQDLAAPPDPAAAALDFLATLEADHATEARFPIDAPDRARWSNLPAHILDFERNGVRLGDLDRIQLAAAFEFLRSALSADGYETAVAVIAADAELEPDDDQDFGWSAANYWLAFFGEPGDDADWGWQFGGHHLAINAAVTDGRWTLSPTFIGVEPARFERGDVPLDPMGDELAAGIAVMEALDTDQRSAALVSARPREVIAGPGEDGRIPEIAGTSVAGWTETPRALLLAAIERWVGMLPPEEAALRMSEIEAELASTSFAWNGPADGTGNVYFRIQGPSLIIEFSTEGSIGSDDGHFHSVYRNPPAEYGGQLGG